MTCSYCDREGVAEFVDLDGEPICQACAEDDRGPWS